MELIPRITRAQKMDALSSQANLAGYSAVIIASQELQKALPMMMTAAGTISPSKVFVIGVGVAGLQAIATAKRLGAKVEAFDTRSRIKSLNLCSQSLRCRNCLQSSNSYSYDKNFRRRNGSRCCHHHR